MAEELKRQPRKPRRKRDVNYYASRAMSRAERIELSKAGEVLGLKDEIAPMRTKLKKAIDRSTRDPQAKREVRAMTEALDVLVKAVAVQFKVEPESKRTLAEKVARTMAELGEQLLAPPDGSSE